MRKSPALVKPSMAEWLTSNPSEMHSFLQGLTEEEATALLWDWNYWRRPNQETPPGEWTTWLLLAGRGFGKTRVGAEFIRERVESGVGRRLSFIGATAADARDIMVEGESGILAICPPWSRPRYEPSKRRLTWPNGAVATIFSAEEPDRLRGPQSDTAWCDELASWRHPEETWSNLQMGLRLGNDPKAAVTTTPRPTKEIRALLADPSTFTTRGSTYDNISNLAKAFVQTIIRKYEGTRLGRQELNAEILDDVAGALWNRALLDNYRVRLDHYNREIRKDIRRILVAVDPAATSGKKAAETGIVGIAKHANGHGYVLEDRSRKGTPAEWARSAISLYHELQADAIVCEVNNGGEMVEYTIKATLATGESVPRIIQVRASRDKETRADPISVEYTYGRIHHVGSLPDLEDQMCTWVPGSEKSPDRIDALVWGATELRFGYGEITADDVDIW